MIWQKQSPVSRQATGSRAIRSTVSWGLGSCNKAQHQESRIRANVDVVRLLRAVVSSP